MKEHRSGPARLLAQAVAAAVLLVMVGLLFYVSPLGPGGAPGGATPTPYPGSPGPTAYGDATLPPWLVTPGPPIVLQRYSVTASEQTGDLLMPGTTLEIGLADNGNLSAWAGCNYITAYYSTAGGTLSVSGLSRTLIGCAAADDAQDNRVAELLSSRPHIERTDSTLVLTTADLTVTLTRMPDTSTPTPVANPPLSISNQTTLRVTLVVNSEPIGTFPAGAYADPIKNLQLPDLPWNVEARTDSGRVLVSFTVKPGTVSATAYPGGPTVVRGAGARADLSCGRLDVWSGPPLGGPMPPASFPPGDCNP